MPRPKIKKQEVGNLTNKPSPSRTTLEYLIEMHLRDISAVNNPSVMPFFFFFDFFFLSHILKRLMAPESKFPHGSNSRLAVRLAR